MTIIHNPQQAGAIQKAASWFRSNPDRPFLLAGVAGSGKTTVAEDIVTACGVDQTLVTRVAPTGKAARVLAHKTGRETSTIHAAIYKANKDGSEKLRSELSELIEKQEKLGSDVRFDESDPNEVEATDEAAGEVSIRIREIEQELRQMADESNGPTFSFTNRSSNQQLMIIDEASMIGVDIWEDLLRVQIPKILIYDPFQLPPVKQKWGMADMSPDVFLTQIMRQGEGSGVALAAQDIREGRELRSYGEDFRILPRGSLTVRDYCENYDLILSGTNSLRESINHKIRAYLKRPKLPVAGDKIVALSNDRVTGISNGEVLTINRVAGYWPAQNPRMARFDLTDAFGNEFPNVRTYVPSFYDARMASMAPPGYATFTFGYCLTVHKSQGSEAPRVCVLDSWNGGDYDRWLYTAVTRASLRCDVVR